MPSDPSSKLGAWSFLLLSRVTKANPWFDETESASGHQREPDAVSFGGGAAAITYVMARQCVGVE
jgi:hypothetical protein